MKPTVVGNRRRLAWRVPAAASFSSLLSTNLSRSMWLVATTWMADWIGFYDRFGGPRSTTLGRFRPVAQPLITMSVLTRQSHRHFDAHTEKPSEMGTL
jgi:hypothetical protein